MNKFYRSLAALMLLLASGGMIPLWGQTTLIDPATDGGFEMGSTFADNGWVEVNGTQTNKWFVGGTATPFAGANSAYISNDIAGGNNNYTINATSVVHFYKDITIPAGESKLQVGFQWKSGGESTFDYVRVWLVPTSYTPAPGVQTTAANGSQIGGNFNLQGTYQTFSTPGVFVIPGNTYRLVIEWRNDISGGTMPGASVDNVSAVSMVPGTFISVTTGDWSTPATWDANAVPTPADNAIISLGDIVTINQTNTAIGSVNVNGTLTYGTPADFRINSNLEVSATGVFNVFSGATGKTLLVAGNIINDGSIDISVGTTTAGNLTLNGSLVQTISGAGTFANGFIRNLTCNNTNTSTPNINWLVNDVKVAYNLNITGARINLGSNKLTWGNNATGNTFTAPAGAGFLSGGKFARFWSTSQTGTAITAGTEPTNSTSRYPFINATGQNRSIYISRSSSSTTGNVAGELAVVYTDAATLTTGLTIDDAGYIVTDRFDGSWLVTAENGYVYVSGTHTVVPIATGAYPAANGNSRVLTSNAPIGGTHQNGTNGPVAQRIGLSTAELTVPTGIYIGANTTDIIQPCAGTPVASTTISSSPSVCPGVNFTLSLSQVYTETGITYQWQSSPDGVAYGNISGATNATYAATQTATTFYQCIITCVNSGQSILSTPVEVTMSSFLACYCAPTYTNGCGTGADAITNVTLANLNNASACAAAPYYTFFNAVTVPSIARTTQYTVSVSFGSDGNQYAGVWIDFNQDGDFADAGEFVGNNTVNAGGNGTTNITFTVPAGAVLGQTMMRVRGGNDSPLANTPCGASSSSFGETEDYIVNIVDLPADPPVPVQDPAAPTCTAGTDLTVPGSPNAGEAWYWQTSASGTSTAEPVSGAYTVFQNGTYFVRTYNATLDLWSANSTSVTVSNIPLATPPPAPVAAASPACLTTTISVAAPVDPNVTYYWQGTVANGIDNTDDAVNPYTVTTSGTYYVSAFDASTGCWSDGVGVAVVIETYVPDAPTATTPFDYCVGATTAEISASAPSSSTQTATSGTIAIAIPDNNPTGITNVLALSGVPSGAVVTSVAVTLSITHTFNADLDIYLTGPNGTTIELSTDNGGSSDNYTNTVFSNLAVNPITGGTGPFTGLFLPEGDLTTLFSIPNGNWTLRVVDDLSGDLGTLTNWSVAVSYTLPTSTITWWDAASGPAQIGTGDDLETIGTATLPDGNTPGTYSFFAQSESGACSSTTRTQVDVVINPFSATLTAIDVTCNGANNGTFTVASSECGTAPFEYAVDGGAYASSIPSNLTPGSHTVSLRDDNGFETAVYTINISEPAALVASETHTNILCNGASTGAIDVTVSGGTAPYSYTWLPSGTGEDLTGIPAGTYNLVVTDDRGCNAFLSVTLTEPTALLVTESHNDLLCNSDVNGSIDLNVTGGVGPYDFAWDNGATTEDISGLAAGDYEVTVTDDNGCTVVMTITIDAPAALTAVVTTAIEPTACGLTDGSIDVTVGGGTAPYVFAWSNSETTEDLAAVGAGNYTLSVSDDNGCVTTLNTNLSDPNAAVITVDQVDDVLCFGASTGAIDVTVTGGTAPYSFDWTGGSTSEDLSNAAAGIYTLTVTDDAGCVSFVTETITQGPAIVISSTVTAPLCNGSTNGAIDLSVTGGIVATVYDYIWDNGATTEDLSAIAAGAYVVTVTDDNNCTATSTVNVTEPAALVLNGAVSNVSCNGGSNGAIDLAVTGGTAGYTFVWSSGANTEDISGLVPAAYSVTVTDNNACVATASFSITEPTFLSASATSTDEINGNDGAVNLTVSGGTSPYTYSWNNGATTEDLSGVSGGTYTVTVTDDNGCTATVSIVVNSQVGVAENGTRVLNIYPNPSNGIFFIEMSAQPVSGDHLFVRDALGRLVYESDIQSNRIQLNLDTQERGIYLVEIISGGQRSVHRIQLQR